MHFNIEWLLLLLSLSTSVLGNYTLSMQVSNRIEVRIGTLLAVPSLVQTEEEMDLLNKVALNQ